jgi:hypothetical protein
MAYNVPNWGSIGAHTGPLWVGYIFNSGDNMGAQFAQGNPQSSGADLVSFDHEMDNSDGHITYWFKLTNTGDQPTSYTISGGGLN